MLWRSALPALPQRRYAPEVRPPWPAPHHHLCGPSAPLSAAILKTDAYLSRLIYQSPTRQFHNEFIRVNRPGAEFTAGAELTRGSEAAAVESRRANNGRRRDRRAALIPATKPLRKMG